MQLTLLKLNQIFSSDKNIYSPFINFFECRPNNQIPTLLPPQISQTLTQVADRERFNLQARAMTQKKRSRSFVVKLSNGRILWCSSIFIRLDYSIIFPFSVFSGPGLLATCTLYEDSTPAAGEALPAMPPISESH